MTTCHVGQPSHAGPLTFFPVWTDQEQPAYDYVPYPQATRVSVGEAPNASVPHLVIANGEASPVLILEGQTISGGMQDRVLNATVMLGRGTGRKVPVSCVERGRWGRGEKRYQPSLAPTRLRATKVRAVTASRQHSSWDGGQQAVWAEVDRFAGEHSAFSSTSNLHEVRDHVLRESRSYRSRIPGPLPGQRGVIVGIAGRVRLLELFDRDDTLAGYWPSIVDSVVADAHGQREVPTPSRSAHEVATILQQLRWTSSPSVDEGEDLRARWRGVDAAGLRWGGRLVHASLFSEVAA